MSLQSNQDLLSNPIHRTFIDTCKRGDLVTVEYMLTSNTFVKNSFIQLQKNQELLDEALLEACFTDKFEVCKFLLLSEKLNNHADPHTSRDIFFKMCCNNDNSEMLEFLIMEYKLDTTPIIDTVLKSPEGKYASDLFYQRDVVDKINTIKNELDTELNLGSELKIKKIKV